MLCQGLLLDTLWSLWSQLGPGAPGLLKEQHFYREVVLDKAPGLFFPRYLAIQGV